MDDLIAITEHGGKPVVNAHDLHEKLEVGRDFSNWIKGRIEEYGFEEGKDYQKYEHLNSPNLASRFDLPNRGDQKQVQFCSPNRGDQKQAQFCSPNLASKDGRGGHNRVDYFLSFSMAKELCLVENNPIGREIRHRLIKIEEDWNDPEKVIARAKQAEIYLGRVPPEAAKPQIDDKGFKDALWLYSIGAINLEDLHRFRFGGGKTPNNREMKVNPFDPIYLPYEKAFKTLQDTPDTAFPLTADALEKLTTGKISSVHVMDRQAKRETTYKNTAKLNREAAETVLNKYFELYGYGFRKPGGLEHPDQAKLDAMAEEHNRVIANQEYLPPVYAWTKKTAEEFAEIRYLYETGTYNAERVRKELFGDQLIAPAKALPSPVNAPAGAIGGIDYRRALEKLNAVTRWPLGHRGLANLCGKPLDEIQSFHKFLEDPRHKWLTAEDAKLILDLAFGVIAIPKHTKGLGKKQE
ncbi:hypothetical protein AGMMS49944_15820 [Spirochaetia bacterium]|nr:hypothetical protein AGMMS49944_15820 [Spirochaetia bacterium]